jgi:sugar/nucleoside kinase (ribokinase family)
MPSLPRPRSRRLAGRSRTRRTRIVVLGDLVLDVVLAPDRPLESGTDVPGRVSIVQGGSATTTARWLARLGAQTSLVCAVGRDAAGRALIDAIRADKVVPRVTRVAGARTGRIGVLVGPDGERSFVQDRGAALLLAPTDLQDAWFARVDHVHLPMYSLLGEPLGLAGRRAIELGRAAGASMSTDLSSIGPLLSGGRRGAQDLMTQVAPDLLFATAAEAHALLGSYRVEGLLAYARVAVVKRGAQGATILARTAEGDPPLRFEVATRQVVAEDTTGAGDAFTAGFLIGWFAAHAAGRPLATALQRAALSGHRAAIRQLTTPRAEIALG